MIKDEAEGDAGMLSGEPPAGRDPALESPAQPDNSKGRRDRMRGTGEGDWSPKKSRKGQRPKRAGHCINVLS